LRKADPGIVEDPGGRMPVRHNDMNGIRHEAPEESYACLWIRP
jgi:hypothetical protein